MSIPFKLTHPWAIFYLRPDCQLTDYTNPHQTAPCCIQGNFADKDGATQVRDAWKASGKVGESKIVNFQKRWMSPKRWMPLQPPPKGVRYPYLLYVVNMANPNPQLIQLCIPRKRMEAAEKYLHRTISYSPVRALIDVNSCFDLDGIEFT